MDLIILTKKWYNLITSFNLSENLRAMSRKLHVNSQVMNLRNLKYTNINII